MTAHLSLPYNWVDCNGSVACPEYVHVRQTAQELNSLPLSWVEELIGNCEIKEKSITFYDISGKLHNETIPAFWDHAGNEQWIIHGFVHREDGPAKTHSDGSKNWYMNGRLHREDGPAIEHPNGTRVWHLNDKLHRENGPAVEYSDGTQEWWIHGVKQPEPKEPV